MQRKAPAKAATPGIKPVVPVLSATATSKAVSKTPEPSSNLTASDNKDLSPSEISLPDSKKAFDASRFESKTDGNITEGRNDKNAAHSRATKNPKALKTGDKRGRPERLDLGALNESSKRVTENAAIQDASNKATADLKQHLPTPSEPATPATIPMQTSAPNSARKTQPKTIRLTETSKHEIPSPSTVPSQGSGQASRRPSITSLNRPETPVSEKISDNVSTSASISRANSPPPSKVGFAPARWMTKSQQKKERQERAKKAEEESIKKEEPATKVEEAVVQAPIVGRKKKTKRTKEKTGTTADSTPTVTRPPSPDTQELAAAKEMPPPPPPVGSVKGTKDGNKRIKLPPTAPVEPDLSSSIPAIPAVPELNQSTSTHSTAADVFACLQASGELPPNVIETLFKPITGASHRFDHNLDPQVILSSQENALKPEQIAQLDNDQPVVSVLDRSNALVVLPNRRCLKGLTPAQANRYRELYLRGARTAISPATREGQESVDRLMPLYGTLGERTAPTAASGSSLAEPTSTPQLNNRFADQSMLQTLPPAPLSVRLDASAPRSLLSRGGVGSNNAYQYQTDKRGMEVEEAELALAAERKNTEALEKRLNALIRKNRRLVLGSGN